MKKVFYLLMLALAVTFTACNKDDDESGNSSIVEPGNSSIVSNIEGTYVGPIYNGGEIVVDSASIVVESEDETHVKISMNQAITYPAETFDLNVSCPNTLVTESDGVYTLSGQTSVTLNIQQLGGETELTVIINGTIENNQADLTMVISTIGGLVPFTVNFIGTK